MVTTGEEVPTFEAPLANGDVDTFDLASALDDAPLVLAFFPGAFTGVCTTEMNELQDRLDEFAAAGGAVYGVSIDTPFVLNAFREQQDLEFAMISDTNREIIDAWGLAMDFPELGVHNVATRSVIVVDEDGRASYAWVSDDPGIEPDYDEVLAAVESV